MEPTKMREEAERRDYFIGQALTGILANHNCKERAIDSNINTAIAYAKRTLELAGPLPTKV